MLFFNQNLSNLVIKNSSNEQGEIFFAEQQTVMFKEYPVNITITAPYYKDTMFQLVLNAKNNYKIKERLFQMPR